MPKPPRTTADPFGRKVLEVLRELGHADDLGWMAQQFNVKVPSVHDWVKYGRFSRERYARLVEWSGRGLHWWFDVPDSTLERALPAAVTAREPAPAPYLSRRPTWPFPTISEPAVSHLTAAQIGALEGGLHVVAAALGLHISAKAAAA